MKVFEVLEESFLRNLVGDIRNAFKPGIAVTPNMVAELEDGLARLQRGDQPTPRQQKMMDTFMSTTLAREVKKMFDIDISEDNMPNAADRPGDSRIIRNMPNAADRPRDPRVIRNMPNAADVNPVEDYINALKDPNVDPEWLEVLRRIAQAETGIDPARAVEEGLAEENEFNDMTVGDVSSRITEVGRELGLKGRYLNAWTQLANDLFAKISSRQYAEENPGEINRLLNVEEGRLKSKSYKKSLRAAKASGRRRRKRLRDDVTETATSGATSVGGGAIATVSNPSVTRNAKKPKKRKGVAPNALDSNASLMSGQVLKR